MTKDEQAGMDWWNALSEQDRGFWLALAGSATPADAWRQYKTEQEKQARELMR